LCGEADRLTATRPEEKHALLSILAGVQIMRAALGSWQLMQVNIQHTLLPMVEIL